MDSLWSQGRATPMDSLWSQGRATPMDSLWSQGRATPHHILQAVVAPPVSVEGIQGRHQRDGTYGPHPFKGYLYLFIWLHRVSLASLRISWLRHVRSRTLT